MITPEQRMALAFIALYQSETGGVSPTVRQIGASIRSRIGARTIMNILIGLEARGFIRRMPRRARAIEVLATGVTTFKFDDATKALERYGPS